MMSNQNVTLARAGKTQVANSTPTHNGLKFSPIADKRVSPPKKFEDSIQSFKSDFDKGAEQCTTTKGGTCTQTKRANALRRGN